MYHDLYALPDILGVLMLAGVLVLFFRYASDRFDDSRALLALVAVGYVTGLLFGVKSYFVLVGAPFVFVLLLAPAPFRGKVFKCGLLATGFVAGLATVSMMQWLDSGNPFETFHTLFSYGLRQHGLGTNVTHERQSLLQLISTVGARSYYLEVLFVTIAPSAGLVLLLGFMFGAWRTKECAFSRLLLSVAVLFVLFLHFMPSGLSPLKFVELQERYLTVILVPSAALVGGFITASIESLQGRRANTFAGIGVLLYLVYVCWVPNGMADRYRVLEYAGKQQLIEQARTLKINELIFDASRQNLDGVAFKNADVNITHWNFASDSSIENILLHLKAAPGRAVYVNRAPLYDLSEAVLLGNYKPAMGLRSAERLAAALEEGPFVRSEVRVPYDSFRLWVLRWFGISSRTVLVGWLYRLRDSQALTKS